MKLKSFSNAQGTDYCTPNATSCISNVTNLYPQCQVSCTGLYADVQYVQDTKEDIYWQKFEKMTKKFHEYLNSYAENIFYNSSSSTLSKENKVK